ncbi:MAG TPA: HPr family phosphocarrier protein [Mariprofundaceae bacterium]|nr:HPr family phosphocarrier protein [Mariprofundaceae bacterium]
MPERLVRIRNKLGLHARASAKFATLATRFGSSVSLVKDDIEVNGKSIMGIMMLAASKGTELTLRVDGEDADEALDALEKLVNERFGEDE